jgi:hypothetical protein
MLPPSLVSIFISSLSCADHILLARGPDFEVGVAITPDALERRFPSGVAELATWYVVAVGREPGIYISRLIPLHLPISLLLILFVSDEAEDLVKGVPNFCREKKKSRREALDFYRHKYEHHEVMKLTEVVEDVPSGSQQRPSSSQTAAPLPSQSRR